MKTLKATLGVVCLFFLANAFCFAQDPTMLEGNYQIMPVAPSSLTTFSSPQGAVKEENLPVIVGETKVELDSTAVKLLSQETNKVNLAYVGTDEKIQLAYNNNSVVIDYQGTTITLDSSLDIGKILVNEKGVQIYNKSGELIAFINTAGGGSVLIDGTYVRFEGGAKIAVTGNLFGVNTIEITTAAGTYKIAKGVEAMCSGPETCVNPTRIIITTPSGDVFTYNPKDFNTKLFAINKDGSAFMDLLAGNSRLVEVNFDSQGVAESVTLYDANLNPTTISLGRDGACMGGQCKPVKLNLTVSADSSVTIKSDVANAVILKIGQDGKVTAIKPDGTTVPIEGDLKNATFHENGQLSLFFNDGTSIVINPGTNPNDPKLPEGWKDWTPQQRASWLANEISSGDKARIDNALVVFGSLNTEDQAKIISALIPSICPTCTTFAPTHDYSKVITQLFQGLNHDQQVGLLRELTKDVYNASGGSLFYRPNAAVYVMKLLDAPTRNALFVDLAKVDIVAAAKILLNWTSGGVIFGPISLPAVEGNAKIDMLPNPILVNKDVMDMFKALLGADAGKAGALLGELLKDDKGGGTKLAANIFSGLSVEDQVKVISSLIPAHNPDPKTDGYKVMNQLFQALSYDKQLALLGALSKDNYYPTAAVHLLLNLDAATRNKLFVDLAKADPLAGSRILAHWPTGVSNDQVKGMFKALLDADPAKAGVVLGDLLNDNVRAYMAGAIFNNLSTEDQVKVIGSLIPAHNPDPKTDGYKVMNQLFQALSYDKQLALLGALSKDNYYPTAAVHLLLNLDAATRNKLFVDLAKVDPLAGSRIIAHWPTGLNTPEGYDMFGALLNVDKNAANAVLAALDADPVRAYFADALRSHFNLQDAGWWDGKTVDEIVSILKNRLDEAGGKFTDLAKGDANLAAQVLGKMDNETAAWLVNKLDVGIAAVVLGNMDANKVANILTVVSAYGTTAVYPTGTIFGGTPYISADKAGQILAAMDKGKAADVVEAMNPASAVPIIRAMLNNQGAQVVADIMKLMAPDNVAAIMAVPNLSWPIWTTNEPAIGGNTEKFLPTTTTGLTVTECADILKAMGGRQAKEVGQIMKNLFKLNPSKAIQVWWALRGIKLPIPWPTPKVSPVIISPDSPLGSILGRSVTINPDGSGSMNN